MKTSLGECSRWLLRESMRGAWYASLRVQALAVAGSAITIDDTWTGVITSASIVSQDTEVLVIGGSGKLAAPTNAKQYTGGATSGAIASDLCSAAGEIAAGDEPDQKAEWRTRGGSLSVELSRLSPAWFIGADGKVRLLRGAPPVANVAGAIVARGEAITYQANDIAPIAGASVDGRTIETAMYRGGAGVNPRVTLWPVRDLVQPDPSIIAGTMTALSGGRASIDLDNGESLTDIPLFCAAGFVPEGASMVRVLVLDVANDAGNTIAITGVDGRIDALTLANAAEAGTLLRSKDRVMLTGLVSGAPGSPVTSPPGAVILQLDPLIASLPPGPPGLGPSRVKG